MDHSGHGMGDMDMMDHAMSPYLFGNMKTFFLLFREAKISTSGHLAAAIIVSIVFSMLITFFSAYSKTIEMKSMMSMKRISRIKIAAAAVFALRMFFHYITMLLVMSMNIWIILAVTFGHAVGYFIYNVVFPGKNEKGDDDDDMEKPANIDETTTTPTTAPAPPA